MTFTVYLSQIKDEIEFDLAVKKHIARLKAHNFQVNKPRPTADGMIEMCIKRVVAKGKPDDYIADYEIIDDTPKTDEDK